MFPVLISLRGSVNPRAYCGWNISGIVPTKIFDTDDDDDDDGSIPPLPCTGHSLEDIAVGPVQQL
jgi:hypothetical protein